MSLCGVFAEFLNEDHADRGRQRTLFVFFILKMHNVLLCVYTNKKVLYRLD